MCPLPNVSAALSFCTLPLPDPLRLDLYVHHLFPHVSRTLLATVFANRGIALNGHVAKKSDRIRGKEELHILPAVLGVFLTRHLAANPDLPLSVIYEDEHLFVLDKPAGLDTVPQTFLDTTTLGNAALHRWPHLEGVGKHPLDVGLLQRLDQGTSGTVLGAKGHNIWLVLTQMMRAGKIEKIYLALVMGLVREDEGKINGQISSRSKHSERVRVQTDKASPHVTEWKVLERKGGRTLLWISIRQGARHQIRAHFAAIGHPIVGDLLYGGEPLPGLRRHFLHAHQLKFNHPCSGNALCIESSLPHDLSSAKR